MAFARAFVTGSAGFVGYALATRLGRAMEVTGTVRRPAELPWPVVAHDWERSFRPTPGTRADVFVHAAFQPPPPGDEAGDAALAAFAANERMAAHASKAALHLGAQRVVLLTSGSVYPHQDGPVSEATSPHSAGSAPPYARSCLRIEETFVRVLSGVPLVIARLFHPYGPRQLAPRLIPRLAERIEHGEEVVLRPSQGEAGRPRINPVYVDDAAEALHLLATAPGLVAGPRIVNIGGPDIVTVRELALLIARQLGKTCRFREDRSAPEALDLYTALDTLVELTGFRPSVPLHTGLPAALKSQG